MPANYVLLEKITVGAATAASVTFSGIPQTGYTDLVVRMSIRSTSGTPWINMRFNGASTNYTGRRLEGAGSGTPGGGTNSTSGYLTLGIMGGSGDTASTFSSHSIYIPNYTSANYKFSSTDGVTENNATAAYADLTANLWSDTAPITSILLIPEVGSLVQYSTFYLYGIAKKDTTPVIAPFATGGDTIMTDGTYWYHAFKATGTFTPAKALTADYLVVAGGGGAGANRSGGGGAGGFRTSVGASTLSLGTSAYTVTVGAGGAGAVGPTRAAGTSGSDSVFSTITSTGGGGGGGVDAGGKDGGSGAGSCQGNTPGTGNTPSTSPSQGNTGGTATATTGNPASGGGGAGAVGGSSSNGVAGNGGAGTASSLSGSSVTYAGGGGGGVESGNTAGTGGSGGGGNGSSTGNGSNGTANTGGGGGGSASTDAYNGGAGGSGIVIVRYSV